MVIIDAHTHGMHGGFLDQLAAVGGAWMKQRVSWLREQAIHLPQSLDVALRVDQLDRHGIDLQVVTPPVSLNVNLMPTDAEVQLAAAKAINDNMARLVEDSKGKLVAVGAVPISNLGEDGRREMERAIYELGLKAFFLPTTINGKPLDSPEYEAFWAQANAMNAVVYLHPWPQPGRPYEKAFDLPHIFGWPYETTIALSRLVFSGVMERNPNLKILSHHLGGMIPFFLGRVLETYDATSHTIGEKPVLPRPLNEYFARFYYDSAIGGSVSAIKCVCEVFGADQVVLATDSPYGPAAGLARLESYPGLIRSLDLSPADVDKILGGNARRILNLA